MVDGNGVWKTRTLMRRPLEERWDKGTLGLVGGVPWRVNDDDPKANGEAMKMDIPSEVRQATEQEKEARNFYITKEHLTKYDYSQDCPGCTSLLRDDAASSQDSMQEKIREGSCRSRMLAEFRPSLLLRHRGVEPRELCRGTMRKRATRRWWVQMRHQNGRRFR